MSIKKLKVEGFKSIKSLELDLTDLNVLIGANGAGKSNFIGIFEFLRKIAESELQSYVALKGTLNNILYKGLKKTQKIYIQFTADRNIYEAELIPTENNKLAFNLEKCSFETSRNKVYNEEYGKGHLETNAVNFLGEIETRVARCYLVNVYECYKTKNYEEIR